MARMSRSFRNFSAVAALGLVGFIGYKALGAAMSAGQPTAVVTVSLSLVLEKLDQRADAEANLNSIIDSMKTESQRRGDALKKMKAELDATPESEGKEQLRDKYVLEVLQNEASNRFMADRADIESSIMLQDLYRSIKAAVAQLASSAKYDVVLVDDSQGELQVTNDSKTPREMQVRQQIAGRRMLYTNPMIDITDDLIVRMNNAHKGEAKKK